MHMLLENRIAAFATMLQDRMEQSFDDLSPRAASVLLTLLNRGPRVVGRIAEIVGTSQPTATRLINGLEKNQLVQRRSRNGRNVIVSLTEPGKKIARRIERRRSNLVGGMISVLTAPERATLAELVDKLLFANTLDRAHARTTCRYCDHGRCQSDRCPVNRRATEIEGDARN